MEENKCIKEDCKCHSITMMAEKGEHCFGCNKPVQKEDWEEWIDAGIDSWISIDKDGKDFMKIKSKLLRAS